MIPSWARLAFAVFAVSWGANQFAPMQLVYRDHLGLGSDSFTAMLGSYIVGLIPALLYFGRVADRIGRRPVIRAMIPVSILSSIVLLLGADIPALLYLGRVLAGLASGMAFGAGTAWMKELSEGPGVGARRAAVSLSAGFGSGALFAGLIAQWLPAPDRLPYLVHIALMVVALVLVWTVPDAHRPRTVQGSWRLSTLSSPRFRWGVVPWAPWVFGCATVSFATMPPIVSGRVDSVAVAFTGVVAALTLLTGALIQPVARRITRHGEDRGVWTGVGLGVLGFVTAGVAVLVDGPVSVLAVLVTAVLLGGGYGMLLVSGLVTVEHIAPPDELAQTVAVFYCLIYLGFAVPFVISLAAPHVGFVACFAVAVALLVLALVPRKLLADQEATLVGSR
ncbi:MFS transporter [Rhodococcus sp. DMU2021]|uniref:MFS transporter n=1 Tax=Rhodococcus sp. DMU2021 TaxID=2866997 RepID=UPI001C7CE06D|nr:MFS transporter [Rhodococcus sp. DMU2021]MBX4171271.1 MFS transporter [Rhodococcus sp. DMU2021]